MLSFGKKGRLQSILQVEASECGLVCIAMIANFYEPKTDIAGLRRKYGLSMQGAGLQDLMNIANDIGMSARPLKVSLEEIGNVKMPAILHWNFTHFVVLSKVGRKKVTLFDPAVGVRKYSREEFSRRFTGVALELNPNNDFHPPPPEVERLSLWDFWRDTAGIRSSLTQLLALSFLIQVFTLATPFYLQIVVDDVLIKQDVDLLNVLAVGFLGLTLTSVLTKALREFSALYLVSQLNFKMGDSVFYHLIRLPLAYFEKRHIGDIVSRFNSLRPIQEFITNSLVAVLIDGALAITTFALMFLYSPQLSLVVLVVVLTYAVFRIIQFRPLRNASLENIAARANQDSGFMETVRAIPSIKLVGKEQERQTSWRNQFVESINTEARIGRLTISYEAANNVLTGCEYVLLIFLGAKDVLNGMLTVGMLYAFLAYRSSFSGAVISLVNQLINYWMIGLHLERVSDITGTEKEPGTQIDSKLVLPMEGGLDARNLAYRYSPNTPYLFENFNIDIRAGDVVAIVGPSGIGKTTILKTLMGIAEPSKGELIIDGISLHEFGKKSFRHHIGAVMQNDVLFSGSIRENIAYFELDGSLEKVHQAAELACIATDIVTSPMGFNSHIGDMGSSLSAGQYQRILLARALYRKPTILFLDEGTAHVDTAIENKIMSNLKSLGITVVFVSHNPDLVVFADQIISWKDQSIQIVRNSQTEVSHST